MFHCIPFLMANTNLGPSQEMYDEGYRTALWSSIKDGDIVYIRGTSPAGTVVAYGPHTVKSAKHRLLTNVKNNSFMHYPEDLLKKENK